MLRRLRARVNMRLDLSAVETRRCLLPLATLRAHSPPLSLPSERGVACCRYASCSLASSHVGWHRRRLISMRARRPSNKRRLVLLLPPDLLLGQVLVMNKV